MALTRDFKIRIKERAERDPEFRVGMLQQALEALLEGDTEVGRSMLRDYVNATVGFEELAADLGEKNPKSLMRMLSATGNPRMTNLFAVINQLRLNEGIAFGVVPTPCKIR